MLSLCLAGAAQAQTTNPTPYCDGSFDDAEGFPVADAIKNVTLGTLNHTTGGQSPAPHYMFYNNLAAPTLTAGSTVPMSITFEIHGGTGYGVWIDFNHNNIFEANEKVAGTGATEWMNLGDNVVVTTNITIPANALSGETRMRVRIVEDDEYTATNGVAIQPCNAGTSPRDIMDWGETEDYKVNITGSGGGTGIEDLKGKALAIYPNPASHVVHIDSDFLQGASLQVVDIYGKVCIEKERFTGNTLDIAQLSSGTYFIRVTKNGQSLNQPISIRK